MTILFHKFVMLHWTLCIYRFPLLRQSQPSVYPVSSLTQLKTNQSICLLLVSPSVSQGNCFWEIRRLFLPVHVVQARSKLCSWSAWLCLEVLLVEVLVLNIKKWHLSVHLLVSKYIHVQSCSIKTNEICVMLFLRFRVFPQRTVWVALLNALVASVFPPKCLSSVQSFFSNWILIRPSANCLSTYADNHLEHQQHNLIILIWDGWVLILMLIFVCAQWWIA